MKIYYVPVCHLLGFLCSKPVLFKTKISYIIYLLKKYSSANQVYTVKTILLSEYLTVLSHFWHKKKKQPLTLIKPNLRSCTLSFDIIKQIYLFATLFGLQVITKCFWLEINETISFRSPSLTSLMVVCLTVLKKAFLRIIFWTSCRHRLYIDSNIVFA